MQQYSKTYQENLNKLKEMSKVRKKRTFEMWVSDSKLSHDEIRGGKTKRKKKPNKVSGLPSTKSNRQFRRDRAMAVDGDFQIDNEDF